MSTEQSLDRNRTDPAPERPAENPLPFDAQGFLKSLPASPGVYRMFDRRGQVIYVGKAKGLKKRVASYFRPPEQLDAKTRALMGNMHSVEVTVTHTETEALLLENNLIKEHRPRYNIVLRDDKSFPYIYVSTHQEYPRLSFHRGARSKQGRYFGPYASAGAVRETLAQLQKLFQVRQCRDSYYANRSRPCLQYQIKRCTAPCVGKVSASEYAGDVRHAVMFLEGKSEEMIAELVGRMESAASKLDYELAGRYRDQIASLRRVQSAQYVSGARGNVDVVAACARDGTGVVQLMVIRGGHSLGSRSIVPRHATGASPAELIQAFLPQHYLSKGAQQSLPDEILLSEPVVDLELFEQAVSAEAGRKLGLRTQVRGDRARWLQMARENAELALAQRLAERGNVRARFETLQDALGFDEMPERLECFDISHTSGEATVASCVVFGLEGAAKADYRRFNIRDVAAGDDYGAMRQALQRRYTRLKREEGKLPDVLLIDGGKGQVAEARQVLEDLQLGDLPIVGVAKGVTRKPGLETLIIPGREHPIALAADSPALHLIQQVRDEAHRFAITGHRTRRAKARKTSVLEHIPGVGARRRQRLLAEFGGLQGLARAGVEDLERVNGISRSLAQAIYDAFRESP
ncbi:MAG: excinuclease ABC subunit UvrC [Gammaproteobacteria bacterium]